ncbi:tagatose 6-phosphate kinase [Streptacidiphilus sp. MAP12-16]|uniref:1-phosphofructokinase family hexose kinase n=1 Tax=Streptacidiphilus sp. MAP12-16 TaxID=3156300 RepID=UPI003516FADC
MTILAVTLNTALDLTYQVPQLTPGEMHRVAAPQVRAGGKGVNVARVLHALGEAVCVTGFAGGATGDALRAALRADGIAEDLVPIADATRHTVTVVDTELGEATLLNEAGPHVQEAEWEAFVDRYRALAARSRLVVLAGSLPQGLPDDAYAVLIRAARDPMVILDAEGPALLEGAKAGPDLVKPNAAELATTTGYPGVVRGARVLRDLGARAVVVSQGAQGMTAFTSDGSWQARPPGRLTGNPTGAGDAAVAALARGMTRGTPWPECLADAVALSAAAVCAPLAGDVDLAVHGRLRPGIVAQTL